VPSSRLVSSEKDETRRDEVGLSVPAFIAFCKAIKSSSSIPHAKKILLHLKNKSVLKILFLIKLSVFLNQKPPLFRRKF
jgi:hypothetical protein